MALIVIDNLGTEEDVVIISEKKEEVKLRKHDFEYVEPQLQIIEIK